MYSLFSYHMQNALYGILKLLEYGHFSAFEWFIAKGLTVFLLFYDQEKSLVANLKTHVCCVMHNYMFKKKINTVTFGGSKDYIHAQSLQLSEKEVFSSLYLVQDPCVGLSEETVNKAAVLFTNTCNVLSLFQMLTFRLYLHNMRHCPCGALDEGAQMIKLRDASQYINFGINSPVEKQKVYSGEYCANFGFLFCRYALNSSFF